MQNTKKNWRTIMAEAVKGIFDELWSKTKEMIEEAKKPIIKAQIKQKFSSAYNDAESKKLDAQSTVNAVREKIKDPAKFDVNDLVKASYEVEKLNKAQDILKSEYKVLFGTELKTSTDED